MIGDSQILTFDTKPENFPLSSRVLFSNGIAFFESQLQHHLQPDSCTQIDIEFLTGLELGNCAYGSCDRQVYSFIVYSEHSYNELPSAKAVLIDLHAKSFKSKHIKDLDAHTIPYPGYHPSSENDEIHTDPKKQYIFHIKESEFSSSYKSLQNYVFKNHLYFVLLHTAPLTSSGGYEFSEWVILFGVGISPQTGKLIGVVTSQACHNLCD